MNRILPTSDFRTETPGVTQAAEGMGRRVFTVDDVEAMVAAGILGTKERIELIGGEIVPMSPKGSRHEWVKIELNEHFQRAKPGDLHVAPETTLRIDRLTCVEPDFCVFARTGGPPTVDSTQVKLAVEIADSSLAYDLGRKIGIYAAAGIPEVWVVNALTLVTRVHRRLGIDGYGEVVEYEAGARIEPVLVPALGLALADLGLTPQAD